MYLENLYDREKYRRQDLPERHTVSRAEQLRVKSVRSAGSWLEHGIRLFSLSMAESSAFGMGAMELESCTASYPIFLISRSVLRTSSGVLMNSRKLYICAPSCDGFIFSDPFLFSYRSRNFPVLRKYTPATRFSNIGSKQLFIQNEHSAPFAPESYRTALKAVQTAFVK